MLEQESRVSQVEDALFQLVAGYVMTPHLKVRRRDVSEVTGVQVRRDDQPVRTDALAEPPRDGAATSSNFQAAPPLADSEVGEMGRRPRIEERLDGPQTLALSLVSVV
jgi:hypothetical protein